MTPPLASDPIAAASANWPRREAVDAMAAATSIMRAHQIVLSAVDTELRPMGLTFARFEVLRLLAFTRKGELPMGKIGERLMVQPATVTNSVNRLESDGLVVRRSHPRDRRTILARITPKGRRLVERATEQLDALRFGLAELGTDDLRTLTAIIGDLREAVGDFETPR